MTAVGGIRRPLLRPWILWTLGFVAFPLAGIAGGAVAGPLDDLAAALLGGAVTGLGIGQAVAGRGVLRPGPWVLATTLGTGVGLALGASAVGYRTSLADLALMGSLTGLPLGVAEVLAMPARMRLRWTWAVTTPLLWSLGWTVTTRVGSTSRRTTPSSARPARSSRRCPDWSCTAC